MENQDHKKVWMALTELDDWFSRLVGAARYQGFEKSEIPLYIGCKLAEKIDDGFEIGSYIDHRFVKAAESAILGVDSLLGEMEKTDREELKEIIVEFVHYVDEKLGGVWGTGWDRYRKYVFQMVG